MSWVLILSIAMAPEFAIHTQRIQYLTEKDCRAALDRYTDMVADDGVMIIARCVRKDALR
jgi:hypothetical protein